MSTPRGPQSAPAEQVADQYRAAWEQAARTNGEPPAPAAFLESCPEADRAGVRARLQEVDREFRSRTVDTLPPGGPLPPGASLGGGATEVLSGDGAAPGGAGGSEATGVFVPAGDATLPPRGDGPPESAATMDQGAPAPPADLKRSPAGGPSRAPAPIPTVPGYDLIEVLGRGGMGVVYKARQRGLKRLVALKMLLAGAHASEAHMARFQAEAEAVAQFQHPNIVQIYEVGQHEGLPYFSLEYVDGGSLEGRLKGKPLPPAGAAEYAETLARAMAYAHAHGIIHRDLKPANVLLTAKGEPKVTDFGLARQLESDSRQTASGTIMGTPGYMAPEQAAGKTDEIDARADVYALGAVLYEMLTGRPPFQGASVLDTLQMVRNQEPVPPRVLNPGVPRDLDTVTLKCLQKDPRGRYPTAQALAADLAAFRAGRPIAARPVSGPERAWRWCRRNPAVAALLGAVAASLVAGTVVSLLYARQANRSAVAAAEARGVAEENEQRARESERQAIANEKRAEAMTGVARSQYEGAIARMIEMVGQFQKQVAARPGDPFEPERKKLRQGLAESAAKSLAEAGKGLEESGASPYARAVAQNNLAGAFRRLGRPREAAASYARARDALKEMVDREPGNDKARLNLAAIATNLGDMRTAVDGDYRGALATYDEVAKIQAQVRDTLTSKEYTPEQVGGFLALTRQKQASARLRLGDPAAAAELARQGLEGLRPWLAKQTPGEPPWVLALLNEAALKRTLADALWRLGDVAGADRLLGEAAADLKEAAAKAPARAAMLGEARAGVLSQRGDLDVYEKRFEEAEALYREVVDPLRQALAEDEHNSAAAARLAQAEYRQGVLEARRGRSAEAAAHFREALRLHQKSEPEGDTLPYQLTQLVFLARAGQVDKAEPLAKALREKAAGQPVSLFPVACGYAMCAGATQDPARRQALEAEAVQALRASLGPEYKDARGLELEPDLEALRGNADFRALVEQVRARQAEKAPAPAEAPRPGAGK